MKRLLAVALFVFAFAAGLQAQVVDTTVCAVMKSPKSFDGKMVRIKGIVIAGFDEFAIKDTSPCGYQVDAIWLSYPQGTKAKSGPLAVVEMQPAHNYSGTYTAPTRAAVTLDKNNKDFKNFDNLLSQAHNKGGGMCLGCARYQVAATMTGRLDGVASAAIQRDKGGKVTGFGGFGNMNAYPARLVLESVTDVTPKEEDYTKSDTAAKGDSAPFGGPGSGELYDPVGQAQKTIAPLAGTPAGDQVTKDVAVYPKSGEKNGVNLIYGVTSETGPNYDQANAKDSPDGVMYNCLVNLNRLEGDAQVRAIVHLGQHVYDLKNPVAGDEETPLYIFEYNAWMMTVATSMGSGQKFLTLPGGYISWNSTWPAADREKEIPDALNSYLANEAALSR
jgi:hypothetical protein